MEKGIDKLFQSFSHCMVLGATPALGIAMKIVLSDLFIPQSLGILGTSIPLALWGLWPYICQHMLISSWLGRDLPGCAKFLALP